LLNSVKFQTVFIDEAAQALTPACWIALARATRAIFAGDHCQLPPTVKSQKAEREGLGSTLFEEIIVKKPETAAMLQEQYRMNEAIMRFSSRQFYHDALIAAETVRSWLLLPDSPAVEFVDTAGCGFDERVDDESLSTYNPEEAHLLLRHLATLLNEAENYAAQQPETAPFLMGNVSIGIISPYKAQIRTLKEQFYNSPLLTTYAQQVSINTVDGFQGQERDVIYISLVRSNKRGEIGFLQDTRRMNVALTRARKKLVVIGDSGTLGQNPFYGAFLDYIDEIGAYRSAWEWLSE
jgi:superfamily I DNA and/or RNA helicase